MFDAARHFTNANTHEIIIARFCIPLVNAFYAFLCPAGGV